MCDDFPLTLDELSSLITVVASKAEQIKKVRAFLDNQLPAGFPVKLGQFQARSDHRSDQETVSRALETNEKRPRS